MLIQLLVKEGDEVTQGQALARLETDQTEEEIALALAEAELNVLTAQQALDDIYDSAQVDAAQALKDVEDAGQALEDLQTSDLTIAEAAQAVAEAQEAVKPHNRLMWHTLNRRITPLPKPMQSWSAEHDLKDMQEKCDDYYKKSDMTWKRLLCSSSSPPPKPPTILRWLIITPSQARAAR
jgi:pyruvate/2-oxoglutarate dehydrogenase complex dihydrolipoamide acyltransferase (E2) component